ncbi:MAG: CAP domain-containing protein [Myxococcales bacterium]|nr:CAP domain-containing protein [Myxococcales bacterium]
MLNFVKKKWVASLPGWWECLSSLLVVSVLTDCHAQADTLPIEALSLSSAIVRASSGLRPDRAMDVVATTHLREILDNPSAARIDVVRATLIRHGDNVTRLKPIALLGTNAKQRRKRLLKEVLASSRHQGFTHFGVAENAKGVVVLLGRRLLSIIPPPTSLGQPLVRIRGRSLVPNIEIQAWQMGPCSEEHGECSARPLQADVQRGSQDQFVATFATQKAGWWTLELTADIGLGPEVAMIRRIWAGAGEQRPLGRWPKISTPTCRTSAPPMCWLKELRRHYGEPRLLPDARLHNAATKHAQTICRAGWALHKLPGGTHPEQRARRAGFEGQLVENLAIGSTLGKAWKQLMESPIHLHGLLDDSTTHVGFGWVQSPNRSCLVILMGG